MEGLNLQKLFVRGQGSDLEYLKWLHEAGVLTSEYICPNCVRPMVLGAKNRCQDGFVWRCNRCNTTRSVRVGSWFAESKISLRKIMLITYMRVYKFSQEHIMREADISNKIVVDWFSFCREVCVEIMLKQHEPIGGPEKIVEIDETLCNKRKYNKGKKKVCQQWVFGGVEQGSNKCFLVKVDKRDARTLIPLIVKNVLPGTTIYSDSWKAYETLGPRGFRHLQVNHSVTFKEGEVCTNTVEGMWALVKRSFPRCNRQKAIFDSYLAEFMFRRRWLSEGDKFAMFLEKIKVVYKPKTADDLNSDTETAESE
ncbi:putative transposase-like protein [Frankliniella fusca]|uniref:Transposase-like protein n=1 Tax=Frankliniella fusca TaxID=407009 RepID=A0AAE1I556_9NEOP|nr:putative transposase-like protein [Frankliniella fusca]